MTRQERHLKLKRDLVRAMPFLLFIVAAFGIQRWEWLAEAGWVSTRPPPGAVDMIARGLGVYILAHWIVAAGVFLVLAAAMMLMFVKLKFVGGRVRRLAAQLNICRHCGCDLTGNAGGTCPECDASSG